MALYFCEHKKVQIKIIIGITPIRKCRWPDKILYNIYIGINNYTIGIDHQRDEHIADLPTERSKPGSWMKPIFIWRAICTNLARAISEETIQSGSL